VVPPCPRRLQYRPYSRAVPNDAALAVVQATVSLSRRHPHAPALDVLDLVMRGRIDQVLDFGDPAAPISSIAEPGGRFGQLLAAAFDEAMTPNEWVAFTKPTADPALSEGCMAIWRVHVVPRKKVEMLFAHLKRILKLDRLRLRGLSGAPDEFLLAATAQNLRRMAKRLFEGAQNTAAMPA
jgi:hypothetical protein